MLTTMPAANHMKVKQSHRQKAFFLISGNTISKFDANKLPAGEQTSSFYSDE
jgi:hypothetical protein